MTIAQCWAPRQPRLAIGALLILVAQCLILSFNNVGQLNTDFGYSIVFLVDVLGLPFWYYIFWCDSRYWSSLSLDDSPGLLMRAINQLEEPQVRGTATQIQQLARTTGWTKAKHIYFPDLEVNFSDNSRLGRGSTASVFSGMWGTADIAVKALHKEVMDPEELRKDCHELMVASTLSGHSNIVGLMGFSLSPPYMYIVMEHCFADLHKLLHEVQVCCEEKEEGLLPKLTRHRLACGTADAVAYLHANALIHRDLKSPNVMVSRKNQYLVPKLADFGETVTTSEALADSAGDQTGAVIGTSIWLAPELFHPPRLYSQAADVFGLGLVVYECLTQEQLGDPFMRRFHPHETGYGGGKLYKDWIDFIEKGGRPDLVNSQAEWGSDVCNAIFTSWSPEADHRSTAAELADALLCERAPSSSVFSDSAVAVQQLISPRSNAVLAV